MRDRLLIASRGSALALAQSEWVAARLRELAPGTVVEIRRIETKGDKIRDVPLAQVGGKGLFTKEIEVALLACEADLAVHSLKDLPTELPEGLCLAAVPAREDARDVLITRDGAALDELQPGATLGTSSLRRRLHLQAARPDLRIVDLRGNVPTRLQRVAAGELDAAVLAAAGLNRLGLAHVPHVYLPPEVILPAVGQGALGIEARSGDEQLLALLARLEDSATRAAVDTERALLSALGGGCQSPLGAHASQEGGRMVLRACWFPREGVPPVQAEASGRPERAYELVANCVALLRGMPLGGKRVLITRPREHAGELAARLEGLGAEVVVLPTIGVHLVAPHERLPNPDEVDWLVFTSANAVHGFAAAAADSISRYRCVSVCAVGPSTAAAARSLGLPVTLTPETFRAEAILPAVRAAHGELGGTRWLWPRGNIARDDLAEKLRSAGAVVHDPVVYETTSLVPEAAAIAQALVPAPDYAVFTSASTATSLAAALSPEQRAALGEQTACISIGPQTSDAVLRAGWPLAAEAEEQSLDGVIARLLALAAGTV